MSTDMKQAVTNAVAELSASVEAQLSVEHKAALEAKFNSLPDEVRSATAQKYPAMTIVGMYIVRQMVKEANGKLASQKRPGWFSRLEQESASLKSKEPAISEYAEKRLGELAEEIDSKEATSLIKKYKTTHDLTSKDAHVVHLCGIFGINPESIK